MLSVQRWSVYNFNSHAHVERDRLMWLVKIQQQISTHTLTWSVTIPDTMLPLKGNISTHTLTWSVTLATKDASVSESVFQLTRSRGA